MEKLCIDDLYCSMGRIISEKKNHSLIMHFLCKNVIKIIDSGYLDKMLSEGYDVEKQILGSEFLFDVPEIVTPCAAVYDRDYFAGYIMPFKEGISYDKYINFIRSSYNDDSLNLKMFADQFHMLENIIKKYNNIVFPNLLEKGNLFYDFNFSFLDFDDIQFNEIPSPSISNVLGNRNDYIDTKYMNGNLFTKQLDIKSLFYLYFSSVFDYDMSKIDGSICSVESFFDELGLCDDVLFDKILRLYNNNLDNLYLGDSLDDIASKYKLNISCDGKRYVKKA